MINPIKIAVFLVLSVVIKSGFANEFNFDNWEYMPDSRLGSNPGGKFVDQDSAKQYYVKFYSNEEHARVEFLANTIYAMFGIYVPKTYLAIMQKPKSKREQLAYISEWQNNLKMLCHKSGDCNNRISDFDKQLAKVHLISVLIKNTDVNRYNILYKNDRVLVVDPGASFVFGASGSQVYNAESRGFCSLVSPSSRTHEIFASAFEHYTIQHADYLISWLDRHWDDHKIKAAIKASGIKHHAMIFANMKARFECIKIQLQELKDNNALCQ